MENIAGKIELYHTLDSGCLGLSALCLILAVVLFFVLDIRSVLGYLTGRQAKKKIRELEASNAYSGRLMAKDHSSMQYVAQDMKADMGIRQAASPGARKVENAVVESPQPEPVTETATLTSPMQENIQETSVLGENQLSGDDSTMVLEHTSTVRGQFAVERELMLIHTEEVI